MEARYLPAIRPDILCNRWVKTPMHWMDARLRDTEAYHPFVLTSFLRCRQQRFTWEPEAFVFGDSGGYSLFSGAVAAISPEAVIRWQIRHCSVGVLLDTPPGPKGPTWRECLARTVAATTTALPHYLRSLDAGTAFRWWGVVHGRTRAELEQWWEAIRRVYPFEAEGEGWAAKPKPLNDPEAMAYTLDFMHERAIRRAHFFASSSAVAVDTLYGLAPEGGLEWVTFDSASPIKWGNNRVLVIPTVGDWRYEYEWERGRQYMRSCSCVSCGFLRRDLREPGEMLDDAYWVRRMIFHNLLVMLARFEHLRARHATPTLS